MRKPLRVLYDCSNCPAWCCSYPRIIVRPSDVRRLARHLGLSEAEFLRRHAKRGNEEGEVILRMRADEHFGSVCKFLDRETRRCTVYGARPRICRDYPGTARCGYYDFLMAERNRQRDEAYVATTDHRN